MSDNVERLAGLLHEYEDLKGFPDDFKDSLARWLDERGVFTCHPDANDLAGDPTRWSVYKRVTEAERQRCAENERLGVEVHHNIGNNPHYLNNDPEHRVCNCRDGKHDEIKGGGNPEAYHGGERPKSTSGEPPSEFDSGADMTTESLPNEHEPEPSPEPPKYTKDGNPNPDNMPDCACGHPEQEHIDMGGGDRDGCYSRGCDCHYYHPTDAQPEPQPEHVDAYRAREFLNEPSYLAAPELRDLDLRDMCYCNNGALEGGCPACQAADEIAALRAENERLAQERSALWQDRKELRAQLSEALAALTEIRDEPKGTWHSTPGDPTRPSWEYYASCIEWCQDRARAVLAQLRGDDE